MCCFLQGIALHLALIITMITFKFQPTPGNPRIKKCIMGSPVFALVVHRFRLLLLQIGGTCLPMTYDLPLSLVVPGGVTLQESFQFSF